MEAGGRDVDVEEISYQLKIVIKIDFELFEPVSALFVSSLVRRQRERVDVAAGFEALSETTPLVRVADDDVGKAQAGQIEGLAG